MKVKLAAMKELRERFQLVVLHAQSVLLRELQLGKELNDDEIAYYD
jgi:hypothetical protein